MSDLSDRSYVVPLSLQTMHDMDRGRVGLLFIHHVTAVLQDIRDRPTDASGKPFKRSIDLKLELIPEVKIDPDDNIARLECITGDVQIKSKVPVHRSTPIAFGVIHGGKLVFNPDVPGREGLRQPVLPGMGHSDEEGD